MTYSTWLLHNDMKNFSDMQVIFYHFVTLSVLLTMSQEVCGQKTFSANVGDIISSVQSAVGTIQEYLGDKDGCRFTCPNGLVPKANPYHEASTNGCGSFGFKLENYLNVKELTKCCNEHDYCYDTCNMSKDVCDRKFNKCLQKICGKISKALSDDDIHEQCLGLADMIYASTVALGCKPYRDAQANACKCVRRHGEL